MIAAKRIHGPSGAACPISDGRKEISPMSETKSSENRPAVADALNALLADSFALYLKPKNYHWHVQGPRLRDLHLLFDEQAAQILATIDPIAPRVRQTAPPPQRSEERRS